MAQTWGEVSCRVILSFWSLFMVTAMEIEQIDALPEPPAVAAHGI